ncbi:hypothetical protein CVT26_006128 [Gymnopilus dilepis]|uniref:Uncharacterized protein n=1 Tax=Gymnopilus dilepis TaxID=231916 RepID=A0A409YKK6_9AGAR|nr:hypothetical protein CVT26_006128 [Gymnopilus dilepis]
MSFEAERIAEEQQPLIDHAVNATAEDKQEPDTQPNLPPSPRSPVVVRPVPAPIQDDTLVDQGNIRLGSPEPQPRLNRFWAFDNLNVRPENRDILEDFKRGALILITTPIAFASMGFYACGLIIEGVALMMKSVGSLGGRLFVGRRRTASQAADLQWV